MAATALILVLPAALAASNSVRAASNSTVYIIRHGEKTWGAGCLNIQGQERAESLQLTFGPGQKRFATPTAIFANKYQSPPNCERCWLTVHSLAQNLSVPIDFDHGYPAAIGGNQGAADALKVAAKSHAVILASWEHYNIQFLTADLGVPKKSVPNWGSDDFDSVYVVTLASDTGALLDFRVDAQQYVPKSTTCPPKYVPPPGGPTYVSEEEAAMAETGSS